MSAYWWQCESCQIKGEFKDICGEKGITHFIWNVLLPTEWDQAHLLKQCKNCGNNTLRISYGFARAEREIIQVIHMVGFSEDKIYLPMMWETFFTTEKNKSFYDFKYLNRKNIWGLNKPAILQQDGLKKIFELYRVKTGINDFLKLP